MTLFSESTTEVAKTDVAIERSRRDWAPVVLAVAAGITVAWIGLISWLSLAAVLHLFA
ncbi:MULTISPECIES: hypothetical protein [Rhodopseudomonas]|uniref:hypothetical protein n=1 Tax=Rhodopseudomonas TaxID=1073 RepID=UPI000A48746A|nr:MULTISPECIES: hypothetical protein [Rhodopseudomonas]MDF3812592.1 hypothetical protein [Rhodopseudomonas sp. BAL398]WOK17696.1 hypothetical protein RBJ75_26880 [Rhodopseudomonas sp. BAL398]